MRYSLFGLILIVAGCGEERPPRPVDADITPDANTSGQFQLEWTITDGVNPLTCADIGASTLSGDAESGNALGRAISVGCEAGMFLTSPFPAGTYDLSFRLIGQGEQLGQEIERLDVVLEPMSTAVVEPLEFQVDPTGSFQMRVRVQGESGACDPATEIESMRLLFTQDNACVPAVFRVMEGGGKPAVNHATTSCDESEVFGDCIDPLQLIEVSNVPSGASSVEVIGRRAGGLECYRGRSNFVLLGDNQPVDEIDVRLDLEFTADCSDEFPDAAPPDAGPIDAAAPDASAGDAATVDATALDAT